MTEQILACPFPECKGERCEIYKDSQLWYVICDTCGAEGPFAETEADAILLWNAAAYALAAKDAEIEQLRQERDEMTNMYNQERNIANALSRELSYRIADINRIVSQM